MQEVRLGRRDSECSRNSVENRESTTGCLCSVQDIVGRPRTAGNLAHLKAEAIVRKKTTNTQEKPNGAAENAVLRNKGPGNRF